MAAGQRRTDGAIRQRREGSGIAEQKRSDTQHIFIIGAKSIGQYGGYETFVDKLTEQHQDEPCLCYHIACKASGDGAMDESRLDGIEVLKKNADGSTAEFLYHNAHVFKLPCPAIGPAVAIYYDWAALRYSLRYCRENRIKHPIFYVLTCRIGLVIRAMVREIKVNAHVRGDPVLLPCAAGGLARPRASGPFGDRPLFCGGLGAARRLCHTRAADSPEKAPPAEHLIVQPGNQEGEVAE